MPPKYPAGLPGESISNFRNIIENLYDFLPDDSSGFILASSARAVTADFKTTGIFGGVRAKIDGNNTLDDYARLIRETDEAVELGVGEYTLDMIAYVIAKIPNTSHKTKFLIGLSPGLTGPAQTDGIWFEYDENDTNWQCVTANGGTETKTDSGIAVASSTKYDLKIVVNPDATSVEFFVNGASKATHTTNIPSVLLSLSLYGRCTETHVEAGEATLAVDAFYEKLIFTTQR